ncbi:hypothetical protein GCM10027290_21940 [Micromonospora sonneratiae]|uniref:Co-chaperone DjlA N-terminal domain-containing protein n=1 Tax=Micromonospora sonneratiae TaxID=1184706 RepID=A0ABW3YDB3_9ACTN
MSHSVSEDPPADGRRPGPPAVAAFPAVEWQLLTQLPGRVVVAVASVEPDRPERTVAETLAGLDGIAAGRVFDSELVRAVATAIYTESDDVDQDRDRLAKDLGRPNEVFAACRVVVRLLAARADPADSAAYRQWVQSVAARVCRAAGVDAATFDDDQVTPGDRRFLDELGVALGLA